MNTFYVSLTKDLLGFYLRFRAESSDAVRLYLQHTYFRNDTWTLPWCAVYTQKQLDESKVPTPLIINARCGDLYTADYEALA